MPKELIRKRGKRKTKVTTEDKTPLAFQPTPAASFVPLEEPASVPEDQPGRRIGNLFGGEADWVTPADGGLGSIRERIEGDAPWGFVDPEVSVRLALSCRNQG